MLLEILAHVSMTWYVMAVVLSVGTWFAAEYSV